MISLERLAAALSDTVARTGPFAPLILLGASFIEYVFPPFPGDLLVVLGAWYAVHGELSWPATFASVTGGAIAGAWVDHRIGRSLGRRLDRRLAAGSALSEERLLRFEAAYRRWGSWLLLANRFLPGVRAFLFLAAGASGIPLGRVLFLGAVSAALWNALLLSVGAFLARNLGELVRWVEGYTRVAWSVLAAAALAWLVWWLLRRRAGRAGAEGER